MAAGDITLDASPVASEGNLLAINGTIEVDDTYRAYAIGGSFLHSCTLQDTDGAGSAECGVNVNTAGTTTNGTISVVGNHDSVNTYRFKATCYM